MVDKFSVKKYVGDIIGKEHVIPTYGLWDRFENIEFNILPKSFALKCTHDSGSVEIIREKKDMDYNKLKKKFDELLQRDYYVLFREWSYKDVSPKIIAEELIGDPEKIRDYKFFVFDGIVKLIQVDIGRFSVHKRNIYNRDWEFIPVSIQYPYDESLIESRPEQLEEAIDIAEKLGRDMRHVRIDLYFVETQILFGEMTLYHGAGFERILPQEWNSIMGSWIKL